jgi:biopolymer transport protein ExbD
MRRRDPTVNEGIVDVNMTPLIDVSLVLVVILMVATPLAFQSSIALRSAARSGRDAAAVARAERVEIAVLADGRVRVDRAVVERPQLAAVLGPRLEASATRLVVVECEDGVPLGAFVGVVDEAKALGATRIAVLDHAGTGGR